MSGLTFGQPEFFLGLFLLLPLLILRVRAHWKGSKNLPGLVSPRLHKQLVVNSARATAWVTFAMQCLGIAAVLTALARPQLGFDEIESQTEGRNLIIAIDTSRSMLADDLRPNRLTRAKLAAKDIILALPEDRVGLLAFAGKPFIQAPLTVDHEAVIESIDQLDTEIIPRGGTNIAAAAQLAMETFEEAKVEQSALVIFSDGEALEGSEEIEKVRTLAKDAGMTILAVGVGTVEGAIIPEINAKGQAIPGRFIMDNNGQVVKSRLEPSALQELASLGGTYIHLGGQASLTQVAQQIREGIATSREESETRLRPIERFMWPLGASILFFVIGYLIPIVLGKRRRLPVNGNGNNNGNGNGNGRRRTAVAALILLFSSDLSALEGFENGYKAFESGDYKTALELYEGALAEKITEKDRTRLQMGVGATAYKLGDYERAAAAYGEALTHRDKKLREQAHYNLGNTLYQRGEAALRAIGQPSNPDQPQNLSGSSESLDTTIQQWESAIEHYESTLSLNRENARATHNREVVKKKLEELKQQQKEQEEQEKQEEQEQEEKDKEEEEKEDEKEDEKKDEQEKDKEDEKQDQDQDQEKDDQKDPSDGEKQENPDGKPEDKDGDGKPDDQPPGEDEKKPEDQSDPEDQDQDQDKEQDKEDGKDKDSEGDQGEDEKQDSPPQSPEGGEPEEPDAPKDGDLEADPNQAQPPPNPQNPSQPNPAEMQTNPETGYSPSEARQLLDTLADETEVRPILLPSRGEVYKNW